MTVITKLEMQAVRAFDRVFSESTKNWAYAEECDASYDAGEWSGPVWAKNWSDEFKRIVNIVADRFQILPWDLDHAIEQRNHEEVWRMLDSHGAQSAKNVRAMEASS